MKQIPEKILKDADAFVASCNSDGKRFLINYGYKQLLEAALESFEEVPFTITEDERISFETLKMFVDSGQSLKTKHIVLVLQALERALNAIGLKYVAPAPDEDQNGSDWDDGDSFHERGERESVEYNIEAFLENPIGWSPAVAKSVCLLIKSKLEECKVESAWTYAQASEIAFNYSKRFQPKAGHSAQDMLDALNECVPHKNAIPVTDLQKWPTPYKNEFQKGIAEAYQAGRNDGEQRNLLKEERSAIEDFREICRSPSGTGFDKKVLAILDKYFPPKKTAQELSDIIHTSVAVTGHIDSEALRLLTDMAKANEAKNGK